MSSAIHWLKEELSVHQLNWEAQLEFSLARESSPTNRNRKIQQMGLDIGWAVKAEGPEGYVYPIFFISVASYDAFVRMS